jgi:hypothetical protein
LRVKLPARVYSTLAGGAGTVAVGLPGVGTPWPTRIQPSPEMAMSSGLPVDWNAPLASTLSIAPSWTPRPTWAGLPPPTAEFEAVPECWIWLSESLNVVRADL